MFTNADIREIFTYHVPDDTDLICYHNIREAAKVLALAIVDHTVPSADQSAAIRKLRECVMTANAAVALKGRY